MSMNTVVCAPPPIMNMNTQSFKYQAFHEYLNTNLLNSLRPEVKRFVPSSWNDHQNKWNFGEGIISPARRPRLAAPEPELGPHIAGTQRSGKLPIRKATNQRWI